MNNFEFSKMDKISRSILKIGLFVVCSYSNAEQDSIAVVIDANVEFSDSATVLSDVIERTESMIYGDLDGILVTEEEFEIKAEVIITNDPIADSDEYLDSVTILSDVIERTESMIYGELDGTLVGEEEFEIEAEVILTDDTIFAVDKSDSINVDALIESSNSAILLDDVIKRTESMIYGDLDGYSETVQITSAIEETLFSPPRTEVPLQSLDEQEQIVPMIMVAVAIVLIITLLAILITFLRRNRNLKAVITEAAYEAHVDVDLDEDTIIKELHIDNEGSDEPEFTLDVDEDGSEDETVISDMSDEDGSEDETVISDMSDEDGSEDETVISDMSDEDGSEDETVISDMSDEDGSEDETVISDMSDEDGSEDETVISDMSDEDSPEDETVILSASNEGESDDTIDHIKAYIDNEVLDEPVFTLDSDEDNSEDETVIVDNNATLQK